MLHLVRGNTPYTVIILFILTLVLRLQALGNAMMPVADAHHVLYGQIISFLKPALGASPVAFTVLALLMAFGQALYLRWITVKHRLFVKPSYLVPFAYIVLSSLHPALGQFSIMLLLNWLLLAGLDTALYLSRRGEAPRVIFNGGFMLGCVALLHFPALLLLFFLALALVLLRPFKPGEWIVATVGFLTPGYFAVALLYLFDGLPLLRLWPALGLSLPHPWPHGAYLPVVIAGCVLLAAGGMAALMRTIYKMPVSTRRSWGAVVALAVLSGTMCLLTPKGEGGTWAGILPGLSLIIIPPMAAEKRSRWANFTFYFLIALVVFAQLALRR